MRKILGRLFTPRCKEMESHHSRKIRLNARKILTNVMTSRRSKRNLCLESQGFLWNVICISWEIRGSKMLNLN
jgi:hypothetical protein